MASNQFSFVCPIFNAETKIASCFQLKELVWMGKAPGVRRGCQACMNSSKCPAVAIVDRARVKKEEIQGYYSTTPVVGKLDAEILERIRPVVVREEHLRQRLVSDPERQLIDSANDRIDRQLGTAPTSEKAARRAYRPAPDDAAKTKPWSVPTKAVTDAAASGDMSAAINV